MPEGNTTAVKARRTAARPPAAEATASNDYVLPVVHVHVPARAVDIGFWGGLVGAVALGALEAPLGILVGAGVLIARHQRTR